MENNGDLTNNKRVCQLTNEEILSNIKKVRADIRNILKDSNRSDDVTLLGACKTMDKEVTDYIIDNNLLDALGDNKVQELLDKYDENRPFTWHFIGNLQSNKVKYIIDKVSLIHSLDRLSLAKEIDKQAKKHDLTINCLIELNIGREESKGGVYEEDVVSFANELLKFDNISIVGLMTVMPNEKNKAKLDAYYDKFNDIFDTLKPIFGDKFKEKSMGMSGDYKTAIEHGSTIVRIGRLIFGQRRYV